jgi:hypothetical protein
MLSKSASPVVHEIILADLKNNLAGLELGKERVYTGDIGRYQ